MSDQMDELKIICQEDCGNAPKKLVLRDFNIAFAKCDADFILESISEEVVWNMIGDKCIFGKDNMSKELNELTNKAVELHLNNIITHGKTGAVNGTLKFGNGKSYSFCDVYLFSSAGKNAKIKEITSYVIEEP